MENRLKERLTGAALLVALIVLVVPEMFRGQHGPAGSADSGEEGPPVRSYTIELGSGGAQSAPMQITPAARSPSAHPAPVTTLPAAVAAPAATPAAAAAVAPAAPPALPAPAAPVPAVVSRPVASTPSEWNVQLGLFAKPENAQRLLRSAQAKGFATRVARIGSKGFYRVSVAGLADRSAAEQMARRLHAAGFAAAVIPPR